MKVPVPSTAKNNSIKDTGVPFEALMIMFGVVLIGGKILDGRVHSWLTPVLTVISLICTAYAIWPSSKNYGSIGYMRVMYAVRFMSNKAEKNRIWKVKT